MDILGQLPQELIPQIFLYMQHPTAEIMQKAITSKKRSFPDGFFELARKRIISRKAWLRTDELFRQGVCDTVSFHVLDDLPEYVVV